ncbi:MAG: DUF2520 domain-containing protein [Terriglobales bacterium]
MRRTGKKKSAGGERGREEYTVAIVGAGSLAAALAPALHEAGYAIPEIVARAGASGETKRRARTLARKVGAKAVSIEDGVLDASVLWLCVPDREIRSAALTIAHVFNSRRETKESRGLEKHGIRSTRRFAFHSSGALLSDELGALHAEGFAVASVHPLMTFVAGARPRLVGVPFAIEGDAAATGLARRIVSDLGGEVFALPAKRKRAYHAWATMTSPLLVAYLIALEEAARGAGLTPQQARRMSFPIIRQTLANYERRGPERSFSGPLIRGDVETVAKHLALLRGHAMTHNVYVALAKVALAKLPAKNRGKLQRLMNAQSRNAGDKLLPLV